MTGLSNSRLLTDHFFVAMALVALVVALTGFATTFFIPLADGSFQTPTIVYMHGFFTFAWIGLFIAQHALIRTDRFPVHAMLGSMGALIAPAIAVTGVATGVYATNRYLASGQGDVAVSSLLGTCTSMLLFLALVGAGLLNRARPEAHKRLMLLATLVLIWPAWFRFRHYFPEVPRPDIWFAVVAADSMIVLAMLRDRLVLGRIHPVLLGTGLAIMAEHAFEVFTFDTPAWRALAYRVFDALQ